jgi:hypothetical protein
MNNLEHNQTLGTVIYRVLPVGIAGIIVLLALILALPRVDTYFKLKAYDDCAHMSNYQRTEISDNSQVKYPIPDVYERCLKDKGYPGKLR